MNAQTFESREGFEPQSATRTVPKAALWTGRILTFLAAAFFLMDAGMKLVKPRFVVEATARLGFPEASIVPIGAALLIFTVLYLIPRTAVFGAVLLTGFLGGAVATNVRAGTGWFNTLFPIVFACIAWTGLYLRDGRLKVLLRDE
jgi:hypothetical protein